MPSSRSTRRSARPLAVPVAVLAVGALALAGCGGHKHNQAAASTSSSSSPATTSSSAPPPPKPKPRAVSPLTGKPGGVGKPVVAVKIDNTSSGRPQVNVNSADVVYVEQVEGGITRLMAIYSSTVPDVAGPVRSGRESDIELLKAYGHVGLAYSGAQHKVLPIIRAGSVVDLSPDRAGYAYFRDGSRPAPYNLFVHPRELIAHHHELGKARDVGFRFGAAGLPDRPGKRARQVRVSMSPSTSFTFSYDAKSHRYDEAMGGTSIPAAGGGPQWTDNLLVQECDVHRSRFHDFLGNYTPFTATVGSGRFWLFRGGKVYAGTWSRPKADGPTHYTDGHGHDLRLAPGRTWVLLKGRGLGVSIS